MGERWQRRRRHADAVVFTACLGTRTTKCAAKLHDCLDKFFSCLKRCCQRFLRYTMSACRHENKAKFTRGVNRRQQVIPRLHCAHQSSSPSSLPCVAFCLLFNCSASPIARLGALELPSTLLSGVSLPLPPLLELMLTALSRGVGGGGGFLPPAPGRLGGAGGVGFALTNGLLVKPFAPFAPFWCAEGGGGGVGRVTATGGGGGGSGGVYSCFSR